MTTKLERAIISKMAGAGVEEDILLLSIMNIVAALTTDSPAADALGKELTTGIIRSMMSKAPNPAVAANIPQVSEYIATSMEPVVRAAVEAFDKLAEEQNKMFGLMEN
jgi:hypothetical protein